MKNQEFKKAVALLFASCIVLLISVVSLLLIANRNPSVFSNPIFAIFFFVILPTISYILSSFGFDLFFKNIFSAKAKENPKKPKRTLLDNLYLICAGIPFLFIFTKVVRYISTTSEIPIALKIAFLVSLLLLIPKLIILFKRMVKDLDSYELFLKGAEKFMAGNYNNAILDLNKSIKMNPNLASAFTIRGSCKNETRDYQGAVVDYSKAILLEPEDAYLYKMRADSKWNAGDKDGAILDIEKIIKLEPENTLNYFDCAWRYEALGLYKDAIYLYTKAIQILPDLAGYTRRAKARIRIGDLQNAILDFKKALEVDPYSAEVLKNLDWLKNKVRNENERSESSYSDFSGPPDLSIPIITLDIGDYSKESLQKMTNTELLEIVKRQLIEITKGLYKPFPGEFNYLVKLMKDIKGNR